MTRSLLRSLTKTTDVTVAISLPEGKEMAMRGDDVNIVAKLI